MTEPQAPRQQVESITPSTNLIDQFQYRKSAESSQVIEGPISKADT